MRLINRLHQALDKDVTKTIFDHLRNYLLAALVLSIGTHEVRQPEGIYLSFVPSTYTGIGVIILGCLLLGLNLYDGIRKLSQLEYHLALTWTLILLYVFISIRVVEMAWNFRMI